MGTINKNSKVFILHGWTYAPGNDPLKKWGPFLEELIQKGFHPILLKVPGLTPEVNEIWDLGKYVNWLSKILQHDEKSILIGHSNGGRIALNFAAKYPKLLSHLILIDSAGIYHNGLPIRLKRFIFKIAAKLGKKLTSSEKLRILLYKLARGADYRNATLTQRQTMINLISTDLTPILNRISTPTLIIWGEKDKITSLSDAKVMHQSITNSLLEIIPGAHHSPQFTHPDQVVQKIVKGIKR